MSEVERLERAIEQTEITMAVLQVPAPGRKVLGRELLVVLVVLVPVLVPVPVPVPVLVPLLLLLRCCCYCCCCCCCCCCCRCCCCCCWMLPEITVAVLQEEGVEPEVMAPLFNDVGEMRLRLAGLELQLPARGRGAAAAGPARRWVHAQSTQQMRTVLQHVALITSNQPFNMMALITSDPPRGAMQAAGQGGAAGGYDEQGVPVPRRARAAAQQLDRGQPLVRDPTT